jgi:hypothetical protein
MIWIGVPDQLLYSHSPGEFEERPRNTATMVAGNQVDIRTEDVKNIGVGLSLAPTFSLIPWQILL